MDTLRALLAAVLVSLSAVAVAQQGVSDLRGRVVDAQNAVLPGAIVVAREQKSGVFRESMSAADGTFAMAQMRPGIYEVTISLDGFKTLQQRDVRLEVGRTATVELRLDVGGVSESVTVSAASPLVDVTSSNIGGRVDEAELLNTPSANRNFTAYLGLMPGVVARNNPASVGADDIFAGGQSNANVSFTLDGANNNEALRAGDGGAQTRIATESVAEFQLLTNQFDAQFGGSAAAIVNAVSKQGTNAFRGSGFYLFQNESLSNREYFVKSRNLPEPQTQQQQFGGTLGGPILRDRAHFFSSVERIVLDLGRTVIVPPRPEFNRSDFEQARIWNTFLRFDNQLSANHSWGLRWLREASPQKNQIGAPTWTPTRSQEERDVDQSFVGSVNTVLGKSAVNTLKVGYTLEQAYFANPLFFEAGENQAALPPTLDYLNFSDQASPRAFTQRDSAFSIDDVFSWYLLSGIGSHELKAGVNFARFRAVVGNQGNLNGTFTFSHNLVFNPADPRTYPERLAIRVPGTADFNIFADSTAAFVQDKWQPNDRLTLNLGVRWDVEDIALPGGLGPKTDLNNIAPRLGFAYDVTGNGRTSLRGGAGIFYQRTPLGIVDDIATNQARSTSFVVQFPANNADPGPSSGQFPTDPMLRGGPIVNRAALEALFPAGSTVRNTGQVFLDHPDRRMAEVRTYSAGLQQQIGASISLAADYVHSDQRGLLVRRDLNPGVRVSTSRTGAVQRIDPTYVTSVWEFANIGKISYDSLQLQVEKRQAGGFALRVSYALSRNRGNSGAGQGEIADKQFLGDLHLGDNEGPTDFERPHVLSINGSYIVPKTRGLVVSAVYQARSGLPYSLVDTNFDLNRNGFTTDEYFPAGSYSGQGPEAVTVDYKGGRNGARADAIATLNLRGGYRIRLGGNRTMDAFVDVFNLMNRANFAAPSGDIRNAAFLRRTATDISAGPRTAQLYVRLGF